MKVNIIIVKHVVIQWKNEGYNENATAVCFTTPNQMFTKSSILVQTKTLNNKDGKIRLIYCMNPYGPIGDDYLVFILRVTVWG